MGSGHIAQDLLSCGISIERVLIELIWCLVALSLEGTTGLVEGLGLPVTMITKKLSEGHPNVMDIMMDGTVQAVVNTVTGERANLQDGFEIRRAAVERRIPCFTSLETARAAVESLLHGRVRLQHSPPRRVPRRGVGAGGSGGPLLGRCRTRLPTLGPVQKHSAAASLALVDPASLEVPARLGCIGFHEAALTHGNSTHVSESYPRDWNLVALYWCYLTLESWRKHRWPARQLETT